MDLIKAFTNEQLKAEVPSFSIGDTVRVENKIKEGNRERIQIYEGTVIARHGGGISETFTVRRVTYGCGGQGADRLIRLRKKIPSGGFASLGGIFFAREQATEKGEWTPPSRACGIALHYLRSSWTFFS